MIAGAAEVPDTRHPAAGVTTARLLETGGTRSGCECGLEPGDVDGRQASAHFRWRPDHTVDLAWRLGLSLTWLMEDCSGGASAVNMLTHAVRAVAAGDASTIVLVAGGRFDAETFARVVDAYNVATRDHLAQIPYGGPNALFALLTKRHMAATGLERADYGQVSVAQRTWAALNPGAVYRTPLTIDDYLAAPIVAEPLGLYDCVPVVTGADAVVVTTADRTGDRPSVEVRAVRSQHNWDHENGDGLQTGLATFSDRLWSDAHIDRAQIDVACIYDDYPVMVLIQLADLGLVANGDFQRFVNVHLAQQRWPLNTSGGMLSAGQASGNGGMHGLVEATRQLRGEAGDRQVRGCRTAIVTGYGMVTYRYGAAAAAAVLARS